MHQKAIQMDLDRVEKGADKNLKKYGVRNRQVLHLDMVGVAGRYQLELRRKILGGLGGHWVEHELTMYPFLLRRLTIS